MKYALLFSLAILASCHSGKKVIDTGREISREVKIKEVVVIGLAAAIPGAAWGFHETSAYHPNRYPESWNHQWWDTSVSHTNKGTSLFGRTYGAFGSDSKHTFGTIHRWGMVGVGMGITIGEKRPWWVYGIKLVAASAGYSIGFHTVYSVIFHK